MLSQLMVLFGFFALVLVSVYWVNRAVVLFDRLIADGHSAGVFLEFTALSLPKVIGLVMPMAAFAAAVYVTNKLSNDSELTVVQATGFSPWRIARPVVAFGILLILAMSIITHFLIPASLAQLRMREIEISGSVSARLLREGVFLHPTSGVTFYIGDITAEGELQNIFLSDRRSENRAVTYTADSGFLMRDENGPKLVMLRGMAQSLNRKSERLTTTTFEDFSYDISAFIQTDNGLLRRLEHVPTLELLTRPSAVGAETNNTVARVLDEAHGRFQQPLLCLVAALIGFSALMVGGFSRFGVGRQIVGAIFLLVIVKLVESAVTDPVRSSPDMWPLVYAPTVIGLTISLILLHLAARPFRRPRRTAQEASA
ncbi:LPS export ABC transporter permease LptF [Pseudoprimorskyibacter insulae]|nr:LPS export ABC transporter permease LptF [Pseudoprimorskyibacter insulae]